MVSASGAMRRLEPWKLSRTWVSTNWTMISMKFCSLPGTPVVALRATHQNSPKNTTASATEKNTVS